MIKQRLYPLLAILSVLLLLPLAGGNEESPSPYAKQAQALLDKGKNLKALNMAKLGLEYESDDPHLLDMASQAAMELDPDVAIWYADEAMVVIGESPEDSELEALRETLEERIRKLDPFASQRLTVFEDYSERLFKLSKTLLRKNLYANAVWLLHLLDDSRFAEKARKDLEKLYSNKKSVQALLDSGIDVPVKHTARYSDRWLEREDRKHSQWDDAYEFKSDNYLVKTNMGYEIGRSVSLAMEQMNGFYREVFQYKKGGGGTALCTINVFKSRRDFELHSGSGELQSSVKGLFRSDNVVSTYDPTSDGRSMGALWSTLFHESSHQFTHIIAADLVPMWLNEGTATYFEGARIRASGIVEKNLIPPSRLKPLPMIFESGSPSLEEVVSYFQRGSYPGEFYPVGWGLVYFFQNYEDEKSERIYIPILRNYMRSYRSGGKHDPMERFVDYFVKKARVPGVETFEAFELVFKEWIIELHGLSFGPRDEAADRLIERARKERADGKLEYAKESYKWAVEKQPDDAKAHLELAEVLEALKEKDGAVYHYRKALNLARSRVDPDAAMPGLPEMTAKEVVADCYERMGKIERSIPNLLAEADAAFAADTEKMVRLYLDNGLPRCALKIIDETMSITGGLGPMQTLRDEILKNTDVETRRWRRLQVWGEPAQAWKIGEAWSSIDNGLQGDGEGLSVNVYRRRMPAEYQLEARIHLLGDNPDVGGGLIFGTSYETGYHMFGWFRNGTVFLGRLNEASDMIRTLNKDGPVEMKEAVFSAHVQKGMVEFFLDGDSLGSHDFSGDGLISEVGLFFQRGKVDFTDIRVRY